MSRNIPSRSSVVRGAHECVPGFGAQTLNVISAPSSPGFPSPYVGDARPRLSARVLGRIDCASFVINRLGWNSVVMCDSGLGYIPGRLLRPAYRGSPSNISVCPPQSTASDIL